MFHSNAIVFIKFIIIIVVLIAIDVIDSIGSACPDGCVCLNNTSQVSCEGAGWTDLPRNIGRGVAVLDLSRNSLVMITSRLLHLASLRNVVRLRLSENEIEKIIEGAFEETPSLQTLDLSSNNLTEIGENTFRGAQLLLHLDLSHNRLTSIDGAFAGLKELSRLDLRNNRISALTQFTFRDLTNLRYLLLADNSISQVDRKGFRNLEKLMYLSLKANPLNDQIRFQFNSGFLAYVDLSECGLTRVPRGLPNSIRYLQMRKNNMTTLHRNSFQDCPYISILVLDDNFITDVEDGAFDGMVYLQQIWINFNRLHRIPRPIPISVQRLLVESNLIREVTNSFPVGSQLHALSLTGNIISEVKPDALSKLVHLRQLDLSSNNLRRIYAQTFRFNSQLRILQLSRNPLEYFHSRCFHGLSSLRKLSMTFIPSSTVTMENDIFRDFVNLTKLDLDSSPNVVKSILESDDLLTDLAALHELGLQNSQLTDLRSDFPRFFPNLVLLYISGSRWHCDRSITWFRDWCTTGTVDVRNIDGNRCLTPSSLEGRLIVSLSDRDFSDDWNIAPDSSNLEYVSAWRSDLVTKMIEPSRRDRKPQPTIPQRQNQIFYDNEDDFIDINKAFDRVDFDSDSDDHDRQPDSVHKYGNTEASTVTSTPTNLQTKTTPVTVRHLTFHPSHTSVRNLTVKVPSTLKVIPLTSKTREFSPHHSTSHPNKSHSTSINRPNSPVYAPSSEVSEQRQKRTMLILTAVAIIILTTVVAVVAAVVIIVTKLTNKKRQITKLHSENQPVASCGTGQRAKIVRFVPKSGAPCEGRNGFGPGVEPGVEPGTGDCSTGVGGSTTDLNGGKREASMSLIPGRDINHEGPLRVYMWTDF